MVVSPPPRRRRLVIMGRLGDTILEVGGRGTQVPVLLLVMSACLGDEIVEGSERGGDRKKKVSPGNNPRPTHHHPNPPPPLSPVIRSSPSELERPQPRQQLYLSPPSSSLHFQAK